MDQWQTVCQSVCSLFFYGSFSKNVFYIFKGLLIFFKKANEQKYVTETIYNHQNLSIYYRSFYRKWLFIPDLKEHQLGENLPSVTNSAHNQVFLELSQF